MVSILDILNAWPPFEPGDPADATHGRHRYPDVATPCLRIAGSAAPLGQRPVAYTLYGRSSSWLGAALSEAIDKRIAGLDPSTAKNHHTLNALTGEVAINADCWAADVDFSALAVARHESTGWYITWHPTLISRRHFVIAAHFWENQDDADNWVAGSPTLRWITSDGSQTIDRRPRGVLVHPDYTPYDPPDSYLSYDVAVGVLDEPLPEEIACARLLPPYWADLLVGTERVAVTWFDQQGNALVFDWRPRLTTHNSQYPFAFTYEPTDATRQAFYEQIIGGDSGFPCFAIYDGEPLLLMVQSVGGEGGGVPLYALHDDLNDMMAQLDATYFPSEPAASVEYPDLSEWAAALRPTAASYQRRD